MKVIRVVAAVIKAANEQGEPMIFATQRGYGDLKGGWEFPGGKIEEGETPKEALKRQMLFTIFRKRSFDFSHKHRIKTNHIITVTDYNGFKRKCQILNPPRCTLRRFLRLGLDVRRKRRREPLLLILRLRIIYPSKDQKND